MSTIVYNGSPIGYSLQGITSSSEQAYIQKHPYLNGPDSALNRSLIQRTRTLWKQTSIPITEVNVTCLAAPDYGLDPSFINERKSRSENDPLAWRPAYEAYAWKVNHLPSSARSILSIGCGSAAEIGTMRCLAKGEKISATDFRQAFSAEVQKRFQFEFSCGHWLDYIQKHTSSFDAAFSNHCMEHIYNDPTEVFRSIAKALTSNGVYVFAMPIEMSESNPYSKLYPLLLTKLIYPWMLDAIDCGHAWKTDLPELAWRLKDAGFSKVEFFFRNKGMPYSHVPTDPFFIQSFDDSWQVSVVDQKTKKQDPFFQKTMNWIRQATYRLKSQARFNHVKNENTNEVLVKASK